MQFRQVMKLSTLATTVIDQPTNQVASTVTVVAKGDNFITGPAYGLAFNHIDISSEDSGF